MHDIVTGALLELGREIGRGELFPVLVPAAAELVSTDPYAFSLATCVDRGAKAEVIWTIPYYLKSFLGHLDPLLIDKMSIPELTTVLTKLPRRPRYVNDAPKTIKNLTSIVVRECGGDASKLWAGKLASEVKRTFQSIHGVGPGIAAMAVLLVERNFGVRFGDIDHLMMDVKPDVHIVRVLSRLGISRAPTVEEAIEAARRMHPTYPGELDAPLWYIGRNWCHKVSPECNKCPMTDHCPKVGLSNGTVL